MSVEPIAFAGWPHCLKLANAAAELIITLDVGPRIISYQVPGGDNVMKVNAEEAGRTGEAHFLPRGGHRFWLAPEDQRTYEPDNAAVPYEAIPPLGVRLTNPAAAPWLVRKELTITLAPDSSSVTLDHLATNEGTEPTSLANWAVTVMAPGGLEIIPQPPLGEHPRDLLPNRLLVPWPYTDMSDERWHWGRQFFTMQQSPRPPAKIGLAHRLGWIGYLLPDALFIKTVPYEEGATYPDFGCNFETFTDAAMLEIETLSPLRLLAPGESLAHRETWHLFGSIPAPASTKEPALAEWLAPFLARVGL
ncbi:MAG: hypothetical protein QOE70_6138 [Chthoniobacter sp.]|jgi:hypothetical protein|nr:hypothetical protein [Chthoniobacter sp.]